AVWALAKLSSDEQRAKVLVDSGAIEPLCQALKSHDTPTQQQIIRCLAHLLVHKHARQQLAQAATSSGGSLLTLVSGLRQEDPDSKTIQAVLGALSP
ncbi:MAG: hypothetical protein SGPRY_008849, partial [Prymnesium sp.]